MDLIDAIRVLRRRWILSGTLLLLALACIGAVTFLLPWTYQAQSTVVLLSSRTASVNFAHNPYLSFNESLTNTAYLVSVAVTDPQTEQRIAAAGGTDNYTVLLSPTTSAPVLVTTVLAPSRTIAERTLGAVTNAIGTSLQQMQASQGIKKKQDLVTLQVESMTPKATLLVSKKVKTVVMVAAVTLLLAIGIPLLVDSHARRRQGSSAAADYLNGASLEGQRQRILHAPTAQRRFPLESRTRSASRMR